MRTTLLCLALAGTAAMAADTPSMTEGKWEIRGKAKMEGMQMPMNMPEHVSTICLSKADVADPGKTVPQQQPPGGKKPSCDFVERKMVGNTLTYKMVCTGAHKATMTGTITYNKDNYQGTTRMAMDNPQGGAMTMVQEFSGRRLGDCTK